MNTITICSLLLALWSCIVEAAPHHENQVLLVPPNQIPDANLYHRRSLLYYTNPNNLIGYPQNNLVYLRQDGQPNYFNAFPNFAPGFEVPSAPSDFRGHFPQQPPTASDDSKDKQDKDREELKNFKQKDAKPAKLELEPDAELIPDDVKIGSRPSNDAPPRGFPGYPGSAPGIPGAGVPGIYPGVVPGYQPGVPTYQPGVPSYVPGQTPQVYYFLNGSPQFTTNPNYGAQPPFRFSPVQPGYDHRFYIYQQPTVGQYPGGQPVVYYSGLKDASNTLKNAFQKLQIPGTAAGINHPENQVEPENQPKDLFAAFVHQQSKDHEAQRAEISKLQDRMDAQTYQRLQNQKTYVDELHQPISPLVLSRLSLERENSYDEASLKNDEVLDDDSVTIEAQTEDKEKPELNHPDLKNEPSVAEAKPKAIAIAGKGGVAQAAPGATSVSGPSGLSVASPVATALAGTGSSSKTKDNKTNKKE